MATSAADIVNRALELTARNVQVSGTLPSFDSSVAGLAAGVLYPICRDLLLREMDPEFARISVALIPVGGIAGPIPPWAYEYTYPADCVRARQVRPPPSGAGSLADPFDPVPVRAAVAYEATGGVNARVLLTNQQNGWAVYTSNSPIEANWDPGFCEAMSRRLSNPLAMAIAGRPDFARELLAEAEKYAQIAMLSGDL